MHVNDTFGTAMAKGIGAVMPKFNMPYKIAEEIAYDPAARDLSVEVAKAKATNADALLVVSRLNDAMLLTRELVKQRWTPQAILSMGPGWYEDQYFKTLGKLADGPISFAPWYDPHKKLTPVLEADLGQGLSRRQPQHQPRFHLRGAAWSPPTPTSAPARPIRRRWLTPSAPPTSPTMSASGPASRSTPRVRTTRCKARRAPEPRRQARHVGAEGSRQRQAGMADAAVRRAAV